MVVLLKDSRGEAAPLGPWPERPDADDKRDSFLLCMPRWLRDAGSGRFHHDDDDDDDDGDEEEAIDPLTPQSLHLATPSCRAAHSR